MSTSNCSQWSDPRPQNVPDGFSDAELQKLMSAHKWGVIYVWSPYMPLSLAAKQEIKKAMAGTDGNLTILADPRSQKSDIAAWVRKGEASQGETKLVTSEEVLARDVQLHYPALLLYKSGLLSNRTYVGHKTENVYKKWIQRELASVDQELK